jgi:hypothetical protein
VKNWNVIDSLMIGASARGNIIAANAFQKPLGLLVYTCSVSQQQ